VAADASLLTGLLRDTCGFTGTVVSDYFAVSFLQTLHGAAASRGEAAGLALSAGIDVELPTVDCYGEPLLDAIESGTVDGALVDRAVERVLAQKCELGLLDAGWSAEPQIAGGECLDDAPSRRLARDLAQRSIVLLRNGGILPLAAGRSVAVVGPRADEAAAMLGCYSFPVHVGVHHPDVPMGVGVPTLLDALRGDPTLFMRSDELQAAWEFATPILEAWRAGPAPEFPNYAAGTWGPAEADRLFEGCSATWRRP